MLFRPETSVTLTLMLARKSQTNVRLMLTAMRDLLESVLLMMMVRLLSANTVNPMVSTTSVNQVLISISISISISTSISILTSISISNINININIKYQYQYSPP